MQSSIPAPFFILLLFASGKKNVTDDRYSDEPNGGFDGADQEYHHHKKPVPPRDAFEVGPSQPNQKKERSKANDPRLAIGKPNGVMIPR